MDHLLSNKQALNDMLRALEPTPIGDSTCVSNDAMMFPSAASLPNPSSPSSFMLEPIPYGGHAAQLALSSTSSSLASSFLQPPPPPPAAGQQQPPFSVHTSENVSGIFDAVSDVLHINNNGRAGSARAAMPTSASDASLLSLPLLHQRSNTMPSSVRTCSLSDQRLEPNMTLSVSSSSAPPSSQHWGNHFSPSEQAFSSLSNSNHSSPLDLPEAGQVAPSWQSKVRHMDQRQIIKNGSNELLKTAPPTSNKNVPSSVIMPSVSVSDDTSTSSNTPPACITVNQSGRWQERYNDLCQFQREFGHCCVPSHWPKNPPLAQWVKRQRYQFKLKKEGQHSTMTDERKHALDGLGFVWDPHSAFWEERLNELHAFREKHGHCNVPTKYPDNPQLAVWAKCQRRQFKLYCTEGAKRSNMTLERIAKLARVDFVFNPREVRRRALARGAVSSHQQRGASSAASVGSGGSSTSQDDAYRMASGLPAHVAL